MHIVPEIMNARTMKLALASVNELAINEMRHDRIKKIFRDLCFDAEKPISVMILPQPQNVAVMVG